MKELDEKFAQVSKQKSSLITKINALESDNIDKDQEYTSMFDQIDALQKRVEEQSTCITTYQRDMTEKHKDSQVKDLLVYDLQSKLHLQE